MITAFQGAPIQSATDLTRRVAGTPPGTTVALRVATGDSVGRGQTLAVVIPTQEENP